MSNNLDRARIADDVNAGVLRLGRRAGIDPVTMKELETKFGVETRANAHALVDGAIMRGHMESPTFRFQAKDSLANIARKETDQSRQYMHLMGYARRDNAEAKFAACCACVSSGTACRSWYGRK
jgi:hypothetical protein